ncbi:MAG: hypothetical protein ABFD89_06715 [Bryobacteraceae bacterium]
MTVWAVIYGVGCIYFGWCLCLAAQKPMPRPGKCDDGIFERPLNTRKAAKAGVLLLVGLLGIADSRIANCQPLPALPKALVLPPTTNLLYFAATASDAAGLSSDYSTELVYTNTTRASRFVLAWDASPGTNVITNYTVWQGRASRSYTNSVNAGTNLTATLLTAPPAKTNRVITVTTVNATNLEYSSRAGGPWLLAGKTNLCFTNPVVSALYYRPMERTKASAARAYITVISQ